MHGRTECFKLKLSLKTTFIQLTLIFFPIVAYSQTIENAVAKLQDDKVIITYDIVSEYPADLYDVFVYSSLNSFSTPLSRVSGAIGPGVKQGTGLMTEIDASEFRGFKGQLSFELHAVVKTALMITMSDVNRKIKRGNSIHITWRGGEKKTVSIRLLMYGKAINAIENIPNSGSYDLPVSMKTKPGNGFQIKMECGDENAILNKPLIIKRRVPLALKICLYSTILIPSILSDKNTTKP